MIDNTKRYLCCKQHVHFCRFQSSSISFHFTLMPEPTPPFQLMQCMLFTNSIAHILPTSEGFSRPLPQLYSPTSMTLCKGIPPDGNLQSIFHDWTQDENLVHVLDRKWFEDYISTDLGQVAELIVIQSLQILLLQQNVNALFDVWNLWNEASLDLVDTFGD